MAHYSPPINCLNNLKILVLISAILALYLFGIGLIPTFVMWHRTTVNEGKCEC